MRSLPCSGATAYVAVACRDLRSLFGGTFVGPESRSSQLPPLHILLGLTPVRVPVVHHLHASLGRGHGFHWFTGRGFTDLCVFHILQVGVPTSDVFRNERYISAV
jgi:hypothetical protein